jgi:hypothetical protein
MPNEDPSLAHILLNQPTILENVFLQDLNQYINDYRITRGWYLIDRNIAQRGKMDPIMLNIRSIN